MNDVRALLAEFGSKAKIKGLVYLAILDDDYQEPDIGAGRVRTSSNAPTLLFDSADVRAGAFARDDSCIYWNQATCAWDAYLLKSFEPRIDGFTLVRMIEAT